MRKMKFIILAIFLTLTCSLKREQQDKISAGTNLAKRVESENKQIIVSTQYEVPAKLVYWSDIVNLYSCSLNTWVTTYKYLVEYTPVFLVYRNEAEKEMPSDLKDNVDLKEVSKLLKRIKKTLYGNENEKIVPKESDKALNPQWLLTELLRVGAIGMEKLLEQQKENSNGKVSVKVEESVKESAKTNVEIVSETKDDTNKEKHKSKKVPTKKKTKIQKNGKKTQSDSQEVARLSKDKKTKPAEEATSKSGGEVGPNGVQPVTKSSDKKPKTLKSTDPNQSGSDPNQKGSDPNQKGSDPNQPGSDPNQTGSDPNQPGSYPNQPGSDPNQPGSDPYQPGSDPNQTGSDPNQPGSDPNQTGSDPNQKGSDPNQKGKDPNQTGSDQKLKPNKSSDQKPKPENSNDQNQTVPKNSSQNSEETVTTDSQIVSDTKLETTVNTSLVSQESARK